MTKLLYTPAEAAEALGLSWTGLYRLLSSGEVESVKIGALRRVPARALERYVDALQRRCVADTPSTDGPSAA